MVALTDVGQLSGPNGAACPLGTVQGLLRQNVRLELFCEDGWRTLAHTRVIFGGETPGGTCYLYTTESGPCQVHPDDLIRVRISSSTRKAGEKP